MGYSDQTNPRVTAAGEAPQQAMPIMPHNMGDIAEMLAILHGPETAAQLCRYGTNLKSAVDLCQAIRDRPDGQPWETLSEEILSAAISLATCADIILDLPGAACTPGLLVTLPRPLLARILAAGFISEAQALEGLLPPNPNPGSTSPA